jgi:hypothetical protein
MRTIAEIQTNPDLRAKYLEWCENPMTELVIALVRNEGRIQLPDPERIRSETALTLVGIKAGYDEALNRIVMLHKAIVTDAPEPVSYFEEPQYKNPEQKGTENGNQ